jgi:hypothetical protein
MVSRAKNPEQIHRLRRAIKHSWYPDKILKQTLLLTKLEMEVSLSQEPAHPIHVMNGIKKEKTCSICKCPGHNKRTCSGNGITLSNGQCVSNKTALDNEQHIVDKFNEDADYRKHIYSIIGIDDYMNAIAEKPRKTNGYVIKNTENWTSYKEGTKEKGASSKSDMCIKSDGVLYFISIKSGKGRLTSADCYETSAIFNSVYENKYKGDLKLKHIIDEITNGMKLLGKKTPIHNKRTIKGIKEEIKNNPDFIDEDILWVKMLEETEKSCNEKWGILKTNYIEYVKDVLYECASGEYKFGDSDGRADWLLVTEDSHTTKIDKLFKIDKRTEELDSYLLKCSKSPNAFKAKTGGTGKSMWIRFL